MSKRLTKEDEHLFSSALHSAYAKDSTPMTTTPEQRAGWDTNPWIYALTFRVVEGNIDNLKEAV